MTVLQGVLAGAGLVAVPTGLLWRLLVRFDAGNERAHAAVTENIKAVDERAERRAEALETALRPTPTPPDPPRPDRESGRRHARRPAP